MTGQLPIESIPEWLKILIRTPLKGIVWWRLGETEYRREAITSVTN